MTAASPHVRARGVPDPEIRPARPDDLAACADVWHVSIDDYQRRLNQPALPLNLEPLLAMLAHFLVTDPERFVVAERRTSDARGEAGRIVAFASAIQREHVWFLAMLFVEPAIQGAGLGRRLLTRVFPGLPAEGVDGSGQGAGTGAHGVLACCTDSAQPISNGLYAAYGIVPRVPLFNLVGRPSDAAALPRLPEAIGVLPFAELDPAPGISRDGELLATAIDAVDRQLLGYAHPEDHRFLRRSGRLGYLYRDAGGEVLGYGYTSQVGRIGPVALLDETLTAPVLGHLLNAVVPNGASSVWVPGTNDRAFVALLRAGLRLDGLPCLLCQTRPFADLERYVPAGLALL